VSSGDIERAKERLLDGFRKEVRENKAQPLFFVCGDAAQIDFSFAPLCSLCDPWLYVTSPPLPPDPNPVSDQTSELPQGGRAAR